MPEWDSEQAKKAAEKSAEVRRAAAERRASMSLEDRIKEMAEAASEDAMKDLISAAQGKGDFIGLSKEKRLDANKLVLAYGVGPPPRQPRAPQGPTAADNDETEGPSLV